MYVLLLRVVGQVGVREVIFLRVEGQVREGSTSHPQ